VIKRLLCDTSKQNLAEKADASKLKPSQKLYWFHRGVEQMRLGMKTRCEIYEAHFRHCQEAGKAGNGKTLDELAGTTGLNRDYLAHVPASYGKRRGVEAEETGVLWKPSSPAGSESRGNGAGEAAPVSGYGVHTPPDARLGGP
jgi:hypothetical protein